MSVCESCEIKLTDETRSGGQLFETEGEDVAGLGVAISISAKPAAGVALCDLCVMKKTLDAIHLMTLSIQHSIHYKEEVGK